MANEMIEQRLLALETLARDQAAAIARIEALLSARPAAGQSEYCRWHDAEITAIKEVTSELSARVNSIEQSHHIESGSRGAWSKVIAFITALVGGSAALVGQWLIGKLP